MSTSKSNQRQFWLCHQLSGYVTSRKAPLSESLFHSAHLIKVIIIITTITIIGTIYCKIWVIRLG